MGWPMCSPSLFLLSSQKVVYMEKKSGTYQPPAYLFLRVIYLFRQSFTMKLRLASNLWFFCLSLRAKTSNIYYHIQLKNSMLRKGTRETLRMVRQGIISAGGTAQRGHRAGDNLKAVIRLWTGQAGHCGGVAMRVRGKVTSAYDSSGAGCPWGVSGLHGQLWKQTQGAGRQRLESLGSEEGEFFSVRHTDSWRRTFNKHARAYPSKYNSSVKLSQGSSDRQAPMSQNFMRTLLRIA